jgi:DNA-directed RNA polymerase subunit RPC12/RpoP
MIARREVTITAAGTGGEKFKHEGNQIMNLYICTKCGHEVLAKDQPQSIKWTDGHVCSFRLQPDEDTSAASKRTRDFLAKAKLEIEQQRNLKGEGRAAW